MLYELAQEGRQGGAGAEGGRWGAESKASCIYEGVPGHLCIPPVSSCYEIYKAHRTRPPLGAGVWSIMFLSELKELVLAVLGPEAVLFNDQVGGRAFSRVSTISAWGCFASSTHSLGRRATLFMGGWAPWPPRCPSSPLQMHRGSLHAWRSFRSASIPPAVHQRPPFSPLRA